MPQSGLKMKASRIRVCLQAYRKSRVPHSPSGAARETLFLRAAGRRHVALLLVRQLAVNIRPELFHHDRNRVVTHLRTPYAGGIFPRTIPRVMNIGAPADGRIVTL